MALRRGKKGSQFRVLLFTDADKQTMLRNMILDTAEARISNASSAEKVLHIMSITIPDLVIVDLDQKGLEPLSFLNQLFEVSATLKVIGITEKSPVNVIVKALKMGVKEIVNPKEESRKLQQVLVDTIHHSKELDSGKDLHQKQQEKYDFSSIIGESPALKQCFNIVSKIIKRKWVTVMITGETGTGKEVFARAIHYNTSKEFQSFVEINCNALPENLLESELFGHEKGAFTDAKSQKKGLFELADNGTLFLDEIGEIGHTTQVKLLKALEEKKIRRVGGLQDVHINTRIISATNRDLQQAIKEKLFRNDLYYRLNVVTIKLPPLRERGDDVLLLANHFLKNFAEEYDSPVEGFTPEAETLLKSYHWPGNVRELRHTIERISLLAEDEMVTQEDLLETIDSETPIVMSEKKQNTTLQIDIPAEGMSLDDGEKILIQAVLDRTQWNKRKTCQILKISRPRLDRKIAKYDLDTRHLN